jgi:hypothetical protein
MGSTRVDSSLACKYQIRVEGADGEKHSSLLKSIQFYSTGPGHFLSKFTKFTNSSCNQDVLYY